MNALQQDDVSDTFEPGYWLYMADIARHSVPTREEERELAHRVQAGDTDAFSELVERNLRLVVTNAKRYIGLGLPLQDLIQEGNCGLMAAIRKYDPNRGLRLSTYATWWIRQYISRAIMNQSHAVRLPCHTVEDILHMGRVEAQLCNDLGRDPTPEELAEAIDIAVQRVHELRKWGMPATSLDRSVNEDFAEGLDFIDTLEDREAQDAFGMFEHDELRDHTRLDIEQALGCLDAREERVIRLRFGIGAEVDHHSLAEIADEYGLSRERIRQIESKAFSKLKPHLRTTKRGSAS